MLDVKCGAKAIHSAEILQGHFISDTIVAEGENKPRRNILSDMVSGNLYMNRKYSLLYL